VAGVGWVEEMVMRWRWWWCLVRNLVKRRRWWRIVGVGLLLHVVDRSFLPLLLLVKDIHGVLQFCMPCLLSIDVLPWSFNTLSCCWSPHNGFLFLAEPLNFLLHYDHLLLFFHSFIFIGFFILVLHFNLIELRATLSDLC
jgi:hypothetical protein